MSATKNRKRAYVFCTLAQNRCSINVLSSKIDWGVSKLWPPPPYPPQKEMASQFWTIHLVSSINSMLIDRKSCERSHLNDLHLENMNYDWYGGWGPHRAPKKPLGDTKRGSKDTRLWNIRIFAYTLYQDFKTEHGCLGVVNAEKSRMVGGGPWGFPGLFSMSQAMFEDKTVVLHRWVRQHLFQHVLVQIWRFNGMVS